MIRCGSEVGASSIGARRQPPIDRMCALWPRLRRRALVHSEISRRRNATYAEASSLLRKRKPDSMSWRVTATMRSVSTAARWMSHRLWASITLKPGSRSRRTARKLVVAAARFVVARPSLVRILKPLLERLPKLKRRILARLPGELVLGFFVSSAPASDALLSERERFVHARLKATLEKRLS